MTIHAHIIDVVLFRIDAGYPMPLTGRVGQIGVTTQTKFATSINYKFFRIFRVIVSRTMTVFAGNNAM
jgi:hypothetical protein